MADPRKTTNNDGINARYETFVADGSTIAYSATTAGGSAKVNLAVSMKAGSHNVIETVGDGEEVVGKLISVEPDGICTVQVGGVMTLPGGASATLTEGSKIVGAVDGSSNEGYIRSVNAAQLAEVAVAKGMIRDSTTATAVIVEL